MCRVPHTTPCTTFDTLEPNSIRDETMMSSKSFTFASGFASSRDPVSYDMLYHVSFQLIAGNCRSDVAAGAIMAHAPADGLGE